MKVRKIVDGDYCLGHGNNEFAVNTPEAVAQNVMTRLALWRGSWFLDDNEGMPWTQDVLGKSKAAEVFIRARIMNTKHVTSIKSFSVQVDPDNRKLSVDCTINTEFGDVEISETL